MSRTILRAHLVVGILPLLFVDCATSPGPTFIPISLEQARVQSVSDLIRTGRPLEAIESISEFRRIGGEVPEPELAALSEQADTKVRELFSEAVKNGDFDEALRLFTSARLVQPDAFPRWSQGGLMLDLAEEYRTRDMLVPALVTFRRALAAGAQARQVVGSYGELALSESNRPALEDIVAYMVKAGMKVPEAYFVFLKHVPKPADMLGGVATIWVNRGIAEERGVGYPDRVIGSGFFIDKEGYLLTNYHVIQSVVDPAYKGYSRLYIRLSTDESERIPAEVVGYDRAFDIALLKTFVSPSYVFSLDDRRTLEPGMRVYAIGSPGGLADTLTSGIVSATSRRFFQMGDAMQIDAPVNPGNSGGPLFDDASEVVGVVFAGIPEFKGVNFAIPAHWVSLLLPDLYRGGEAIHPWLGMALRETPSGLAVLYVVPGSPADGAGIEEGDLVSSLDGVPVTGIVELQERLLEAEPNSLVKLAWRHGSKAESGLISLEDRPFLPLETAAERDTRDDLFLPLFGMKVESTGASSYRVTKVYPNMAADAAGISAGDPMNVVSWAVNPEQGYAALAMTVSRKKDGFLETGIQLAGRLDPDNFI